MRATICGLPDCGRPECQIPPTPLGERINVSPRVDFTSPAAEESARRKGMPLFDGCFMYFADALLAVGQFSRKANEKHNPGETVRWAREKSQDQANCVGRHLLDIGPEWDEIDPEFDEPHAVALAWRSLALLQTLLEAKRRGMKVSDYQKWLRENKPTNAVR